jgi:hypothetical protein
VLGRCINKVDDRGLQGISLQIMSMAFGILGIAAPPASTSMAGGPGWFGRGAAIRGLALQRLDFRFGDPFRASRRSRQGWLR